LGREEKMFRKDGKQYKGENHPLSKLTQEAVDEIRSRYKEGGVTHEKLAKDYHVSPSLIGKVVRRELWS
jgi:hypothetical protein